MKRKNYVELDKVIIQCPECNQNLYRKGDLKIINIKDDKEIIELLQDKGLISKCGNKYYSSCVRGEEITIEIKEFLKQLKGYD